MGRLGKIQRGAVALAPLLLAMLVSCGKTLQEGRQCEETPLAFTATAPLTKSTYISSGTLGELPLYLSADYHEADGSVSSFLSNGSFARGGDGFYHSSPDEVYWPMGSGTMDFLSYAGTDGPLSDEGNPCVEWDSPRATSGATFTFTDTKSADVDLVWAVANNRRRSGGAVALDFSHALARLELQVEISPPLGDYISLQSVTLETSLSDRLCLGGVFTVDNSKNTPEASWSELTTTSDYGFFTGQDITFTPEGETSLVGQLDGTPRVAKIDAVVPLVNMYVPPQPVKNIEIIYSLNGGTPRLQTVNLPRGSWEMGHTYTYRLTYTLMGLKGGYAGFDLLMFDHSRKYGYSGSDVR